MELLSRQKLDAFLSIIGKFRIFKGKSEAVEVSLPSETTTVAASSPLVNVKAMPLAKNVETYFGQVKWTITQAEQPIVSLPDEPAVFSTPSLERVAVQETHVSLPLADRRIAEPLPQVNLRPVTGTVHAFFSTVAWSGNPTLPAEQTVPQPQSIEVEKSSAYALVGGVQDYFANVSWAGSSAAEKSTVAVLERPAPQEEQASEDFFGDISWD